MCCWQDDKIHNFSLFISIKPMHLLCVQLHFSLSKFSCYHCFLFNSGQVKNKRICTFKEMNCSRLYIVSREYKYQMKAYNLRQMSLYYMSVLKSPEHTPVSAHLRIKTWAAYLRTCHFTLVCTCIFLLMQTRVLNAVMLLLIKTHKELKKTKKKRLKTNISTRCKISRRSDYFQPYPHLLVCYLFICCLQQQQKIKGGLIVSLCVFCVVRLR